MKLAIITARGGSKRIPRKNIKDFLGKPLIAYSIEAALSSGVFDKVMVSTDDLEIAEIAKKYGAAVPFMRSEATSNDYATTADVLIEVLEEYKKLGMVFKYFCCIYPTAPFLTGKKLKESAEKFQESKATSLLSVCRFSFPIQRALRIQGDRVQMMYPENLNVRSQDLEPAFHDAGQFYWGISSNLIKTRTLLTDNSVAFELSELEVQDIDNISDWEIAEAKFKHLMG